MHATRLAGALLKLKILAFIGEEIKDMTSKIISELKYEPYFKLSDALFSLGVWAKVRRQETLPDSI